MENIIEVTGKDLFFVTEVEGRVLPYKNTKENSHLKGKNYLTFTFNGIAFTVIEGHSFIKDKRAGNVAEIRLKNVDGKLEFVNHMTKEQKKAYNEMRIDEAKTEGALLYYKSTPFKPESIKSHEELPA